VTNREVIIKGLQNKLQDANVVDYIECPYSSFDDCLNEQLAPNCIHDYEDPIFKARCRDCKTKWLNKEWKSE